MYLRQCSNFKPLRSADRWACLLVRIHHEADERSVDSKEDLDEVVPAYRKPRQFVTVSSCRKAQPFNDVLDRIQGAENAEIIRKRQNAYNRSKEIDLTNYITSSKLKEIDQEYSYDNYQPSTMSLAARLIIESGNTTEPDPEVDAEIDDVKPTYPFANFVTMQSVKSGRRTRIDRLREKSISTDREILTGKDAVDTDEFTNIKTLGDDIYILPSEEEKLSEFNYVEEATANFYEKSSDKDWVRRNIWRVSYGKPDPEVKPSKVPCGGCGANLHCQDVRMPGYLPSEKFVNYTNAELRTMMCQRCYFLRKFNVALNVSVSPEEYPAMLESVKKSHSMVALVLDVLDFPFNVWPSILEVIGTTKPLFIVVNKVDLLPRDDKDYLKRLQYQIRGDLKRMGVDTGHNIRGVEMVSAKTGFGIENLITNIQKHWGCNGDLFLIGCANVGKSSLFNALLQSDLCKITAVDLIERATTSPWPGTTLNLLKFPMMRPAPWKLAIRARRLKMWRAELAAEKKLRDMQFARTGNYSLCTLMGHVGFTFKLADDDHTYGKNPFSMNSSIVPPPRLQKSSKQKHFQEKSHDFVNSKWCYDTPGSMHKEQVLSLLTHEELMMTVPKSIIVPRTYLLKPGEAFFLAGLARVDLLSLHTDDPPNAGAYMTVFSSSHLPCSIVNLEEADQFYREHLGSDLLKVPKGGPTRMKDFPKLEAKEFNVTGISLKESAGDILLSSAGWISVTLRTNVTAAFKAYTPEGRGCMLRQPAFLPFAINFRGKRISHAPKYEDHRVHVD